MNIRTMEIDGEIHFNVYDLSIECGCYKMSKGRKYARKERVSNTFKKMNVGESEYISAYESELFITCIGTEKNNNIVIDYIRKACFPIIIKNDVINVNDVHTYLGIATHLRKWIDRLEDKGHELEIYYEKNDDIITRCEYNENEGYYKNRGYSKNAKCRSEVMLEILASSVKNSERKSILMNHLIKSVNIIHLKDNERMEIKFLNQLEDSLKPFKIGGNRQYPIDGGKYRIDYYIPSLGLAIEYDEEQHCTLANKIKDEERQKYIEDKLKCEFVRCSYKNTDAYNIGLVMKKIFKYI